MSSRISISPKDTAVMVLAKLFDRWTTSGIDPIRGLPTCQGNSYLFANSDSTKQFPCEWALACTF